MEFNPNNLTSVPTTIGVTPLEGPKTVPLSLDFNSQSSYSLDFTGQQIRRQISVIRGVYVDNSAGDGEVNLTVQGTEQTLIVPARSQAYLTILAARDFKCVVSGPSVAAIVNFQFFNVPVSDFVWRVNSVSVLPIDLAGGPSEVTGILPIVNGGTGTDTPAIVAGSGISVSGAWPDQTISNTDKGSSVLPINLAGGAGEVTGVLPVADGGTGTGAPSIVAGSGISVTGAWPNQSVTNTDKGSSVLPINLAGGAGEVTGVLPVADGGNGTAAPAIVAGSGIGVSGVWPTQTISNTDKGSSVLPVNLAGGAGVVTGLLPIANGGNASAAPGITAGNNVAVTGAWPTQQVTAKATVQHNGVDVGTEQKINLIDGTNVTLTVADSAGNNRVDVTIAASASGSSSAYFGGTGIASSVPLSAINCCGLGVNTAFGTATAAGLQTREFLMPRAGTLKNFSQRIIGINQPASGSLIATVMVNGIATALTVTFPAADVQPLTRSDITHTVVVAAGDRVTIQLANNATAQSAGIGPWSLELA